MRRKQPQENPEMEGLKSSGVDCVEQLGVSEHKSKQSIADNKQQHNELVQMELPSLAMQGLLHAFVKLRIISIIAEGSYGQI